MASANLKFNLPAHLADKVATFGESSYGATLVTLVLKNGTRIPHVHVAWRLHVIKATGSKIRCAPSWTLLKSPMRYRNPEE